MPSNPVHSDLRSRYHERPPPAFLANAVACVWEQHIEGSAGTYMHSVLPDGYMDLVWIDDAKPVVVGPATSDVRVALPAGSRVVGVRFRIGFAGPLLGIPADELRDRTVPLSDMWPGASEERTARWGSVDHAPHAGAEPWLATRIGSAPPADPLVTEGARLLSRAPNLAISGAAARLGVTERTLRRRFRAAVGYGPKLFGRIMRLQLLLRASRSKRDAPATLSGLALEAGYADQAHMSREVRALSGRAPSDLLRGRLDG